MLTPDQYLRIALDPLRLAILGNAALGPVDAGALAEALDVPTRKVVKAVGRLREIGLIRDDATLDRAALRSLAQGLPQEEPASEAIVDGDWTPGEIRILNRFFSGTRLTEIPSSMGKRLVVLERLAQEFELGERYPEKQVNFRLQLFHPDFATLRRYLVDVGLLSRAEGVYWRTGGRFVGDDPAEA